MKRFLSVLSTVALSATLGFALCLPSAHAQASKADPKAKKMTGESLQPGRTIAPATKPAMDKADSAKFNAAFKELYPAIKPSLSLRERTIQEFNRQIRMLKSRGVDSAVAIEKVLSSIDPNMDETLLANAYRAEFSPEEIKSLATFFKSSAGKRYLEVEGKLIGARNAQIEGYIRRTISSVVTPMAKPIERPQHPGTSAPGVPHVPGTHPAPAPGVPPVAPAPPAEPAH